MYILVARSLDMWIDILTKRILWEARLTDFMPDAHTLFIVVQTVFLGRPIQKNVFIHLPVSTPIKFSKSLHVPVITRFLLPFPREDSM